MKRKNSIKFAGNFLIICVISIVGCSKVTNTTNSKAEPSKNAGKPVSLEELNQGHDIYTSNCGRCHKLFDPTQFSDNKWESVLPDMGKKSKITDEQLAKVKNYIFSKRTENEKKG